MNFLKTTFILGQHARVVQCTIRRNYQHMPEYAHLFKQFNATYPGIKKYLVDQIKEDWAKEEYNQMLDHQLRAGRQSRAAIVLKVNEVMTKKSCSEAESDGLQRIHIMAWIMETLHSAAILIDDYIDDSELRRGELPWYVGKGKHVAPDCTLMTLTPYFLLNGWFGKDSFYHSAATLLQELAFDIILAQGKAEFHIIELFKKRNLSYNDYRSYVLMKSNYYIDGSFKMAAYESTKLDLKFDEKIDVILEDFTCLIQIQNDLLTMESRPDHFTNDKDLDEDIKKGKINFGVTLLMGCATENDKHILTENLGKEDQRCIDVVRALYDKYNIQKAIRKYVEDQYVSLEERIDSISNDLGLRDGLHAVKESVKLYAVSDPGVKNDYPEAMAATMVVP